MDIEQIFHEERRRQQRLDDTYMAVMALPRTERIQLIVRIVDADATGGRGPARRRR
jgi:hypothetical protein